MKPEPLLFLNAERVKVGAQPINWINDDFRDLGKDTTLEQCLKEMGDAGYAGSELGHRFPEKGVDIRKLLSQFDLRLVGGWHSTHLADRPFEDEVRAFVAHTRRLHSAGADICIVAECTEARHGDGMLPLQFTSHGRVLDDKRMKVVAEGLDKLTQRAALHGIRVCYHMHMGTVIQDAIDVDELMARTEHLQLVLDTGHLRFAGVNPLHVLKKHKARVAHVHLKNVRAGVAAQAKAEGWSFERAVRAGVFTVPGDDAGCIDFGELFAELADSTFRGWFVVEAEQDPAKANPLEYAKKARAYVRRVGGV